MSGTETAIIEGIKNLIGLAGTLFVGYNGFVFLLKEQTKRKEIEIEHETKRVEIEAKQAEVVAKENSVGQEAIDFMRKEIKDLKQSRDEQDVKNKALDRAIQSIEYLCEFLEKRMNEIFKR